MTPWLTVLIKFKKPTVIALGSMCLKLKRESWPVEVNENKTLLTYNETKIVGTTFYLKAFVL